MLSVLLCRESSWDSGPAGKSRCRLFEKPYEAVMISCTNATSAKRTERPNVASLRLTHDDSSADDITLRRCGWDRWVWGIETGVGRKLLELDHEAC